MKNTTQRIDAVWDNYPEENNLKALTQQRRGNGPRTRVGDGSTPIPKREWNSGFFKTVENKKELFSFISTQISKLDMDGKLLLSTHFETVLAKRDCDLTTLQPCNQFRGRHQDPPASGTCRTTGSYNSLCSHGGQRRRGIDSPVFRYARPIGALGWFRNRKKIP